MADLGWCHTEEEEDGESRVVQTHYKPPPSADLRHPPERRGPEIFGQTLPPTLPGPGGCVGPCEAVCGPPGQGQEQIAAPWEQGGILPGHCCDMQQCDTCVCDVTLLLEHSWLGAPNLGQPRCPERCISILSCALHGFTQPGPCAQERLQLHSHSWAGTAPGCRQDKV